MDIVCIYLSIIISKWLFIFLILLLKFGLSYLYGIPDSKMLVLDAVLIFFSIVSQISNTLIIVDSYNLFQLLL